MRPLRWYIVPLRYFARMQHDPVAEWEWEVRARDPQAAFNVALRESKQQGFSTDRRVGLAGRIRLASGRAAA